MALGSTRELHAPSATHALLSVGIVRLQEIVLTQPERGVSLGTKRQTAQLDEGQSEGTLSCPLTLAACTVYMYSTTCRLKRCHGSGILNKMPL